MWPCPYTVINPVGPRLEARDDPYTGLEHAAATAPARTRLSWIRRFLKFLRARVRRSAAPGARQSPWRRLIEHPLWPQRPELGRWL